MKFSEPVTARTYSDRSVDPSWIEWCKSELNPVDKDIIDIGCGGGIYSDGFLQCGANSVTGVDASEQYVLEARKTSPTTAFIHAPCEKTGLRSESADLIFERALIHHLTPEQLTNNANEMFRLLRADGIAVVQDRTINDALADSDRFWIRRELMKMFPRLVEYEQQRRPEASDYQKVLKDAGFDEVTLSSYTEVRKIYPNKDQLDQELASRKGKSILFKLNDEELKQYRERIMELSPSSDIEECDRWTIWIGKKSCLKSCIRPCFERSKTWPILRIQTKRDC